MTVWRDDVLDAAKQRLKSQRADRPADDRDMMELRSDTKERHALIAGEMADWSRAAIERAAARSTSAAE